MFALDELLLIAEWCPFDKLTRDRRWRSCERIWVVEVIPKSLTLSEVWVGSDAFGGCAPHNPACYALLRWLDLWAADLIQGG